MKKNLRSIIISSLLFFLGFSFGDDIVLQIPDKYFNNTPAISSNRSQISFSASGNQGFGVFFLGTGTPSSTTLTLNGNSISCSSKLNGFYTINFTNFSMFPLDSISASNISDPGIKLAQGGLFYNCKKGNTNYTGVYGFIRRNYGANLENTHEIRAGIDPSTRTRDRSSPLQLIYSDNFRNSHRALSGSFYTNLASFSNTTPHFFGDIRLSSGNTILSPLGSASDTYYLIDQNAYNNNQIKVNIASSHTNTDTKTRLTGFDTNGQIATNTVGEQLVNGVVPFGFSSSYTFSLKDQFNSTFSLSSGIILADLNNLNNKQRQKTIRFVLTGNNLNQNFQILYNPMSCTSGSVQVSVSGTNISSYKINGQSGPVSFTSNQTGIVDVSFSNNSTGSTIFDISWIDKTGANIPNNINATGTQCSSLTGSISVSNIGCSTTLQGRLNNSSRQNLTKSGDNFIFNYSTSSLVATSTNNILYIKDNLGNISSGAVNFTWQATNISASDFSLQLVSDPSGGYTTSGNRKILSNLTFGNCNTGNIVATVQSCQHNTGQIDGDIFTYSVDEYPSWNSSTCQISLSDSTSPNTPNKIITVNIIKDNYAPQGGPTYIVLQTGDLYSTAELKLKRYEQSIFDTSLIDLCIKTTRRTTCNLPKDNIQIKANNSKDRPESTNITIDITQTEQRMQDFDESGFSEDGQFVVKIDSGFLLDLALNQSEPIEIDTNYRYLYGNYLWTKPTITTGLDTINSGFIIDIFTKQQIEVGTSSITCIDSSTCPGFTCSQTGIIEGSNLSTPEAHHIVLDDGSRSGDATFYKKYSLQIDPMIDPNDSDRTNWSGCQIKLTDGRNTATLSVGTKKAPFKAGISGRESRYTDTIFQAVNQYGGDHGFFFYISNPQRIKIGNSPNSDGVLGDISYEIDFSEPVADEFYYITGTAIINGYKKELQIKKPTFNYENPNSYLFIFPDYQGYDNQ